METVASTSFQCGIHVVCLQRTAPGGVLCKKVFLKLRKTHREALVPAATLFKKAQVFSSKFCEFSKNIFFTERLWMTSSVSMSSFNFFILLAFRASVCVCVCVCLCVGGRVGGV